MPIPAPPGVGGENLGHHAAGSPGLHAWHGSLTQNYMQVQGWEEVQIWPVSYAWKPSFLEHAGNFFPKALSILQGILFSFSLLVSIQMRDLWCLVTLLFLLFMASDKHNSLLVRPLRAAVEEPWVVVIPFPGGNKQQQSNFHGTKIVWLFSHKEREGKQIYIGCVLICASHKDVQIALRRELLWSKIGPHVVLHCWLKWGLCLSFPMQIKGLVALPT